MAIHTKRRLASILNSVPLASSIHRSIACALKCPFVHLAGGKSVWEVFQASLNAAIRDIERHPRGKLFRRLIEHGPHHPDDPEAPTSDRETVLSDPECGKAVEFIFSHMVNRFKGELAELLALEPCIQLVEQLQQDKRVPSNAQVHWGETVRERPYSKRRVLRHWAKGADGLLVAERPGAKVQVLGIAEVKSMRRSSTSILGQIDRHLARLDGGLKLGDREFPPEAVTVTPGRVTRMIFVPSGWKLSRDFHWEKGDHGGRSMVFPNACGPPVDMRKEQIGPNVWRITLAWSQEALEQAAYEMTYWYMAEVGKAVFTGKTMPKGWEGFTSAEAGCNAVKMMLYYMPLRYLSARQQDRAVKLYNIYSFGYPLGVDHKEMMWPEDLV